MSINTRSMTSLETLTIIVSGPGHGHGHALDRENVQIQYEIMDEVFASITNLDLTFIVVIKIRCLKSGGLN